MSTKKITFPNNLECYYISSKEETEFIFSEIFVEKQYLRNCITLKPGDCIFDVGANIGLFSLFVSQLQEKLNIFAFEPIPATFAVLSENVNLHDLQNISLFNYALSSENNLHKLFTFYPNLAGNSTAKPEEKPLGNENLTNVDILDSGENVFNHLFNEQIQVSCETKTLSSVIKELGINSIDLLKIDVEGEEYEVLQGIEDEDWKKIKQIVAEVQDIEGRLDKIQNLIKNYGFEVKIEKNNLLPDSLKNFNLYAVRQL